LIVPSIVTVAFLGHVFADADGVAIAITDKESVEARASAPSFIDFFI
jgi:hypothetical protein